MADDTSSLDEHRGMAAQRATEARRRKSDVIKDQSALKARRDELEKFLLTAPAESWPDAVAKAFKELKEVGLVRDGECKVHSAQAAGSAPVIHALHKGTDLITPVKPDTIAKSIASTFTSSASPGSAPST